MNDPKAVDNEQWELLGGQPLFGGTHRLQSHAENGAIFHAPLYSPTTTVHCTLLVLIDFFFKYRLKNSKCGGVQPDIP